MAPEARRDACTSSAISLAARGPMACTNAVASDILNSDPDSLSFGYERLRAMRVGAIHGSRGA